MASRAALDCRHLSCGGYHAIALAEPRESSAELRARAAEAMHAAISTRHDQSPPAADGPIESGSAYEAGGTHHDPPFALHAAAAPSGARLDSVGYGLNGLNGFGDGGDCGRGHGVAYGVGGDDSHQYDLELPHAAQFMLQSQRSLGSEALQTIHAAAAAAAAGIPPGAERVAVERAAFERAVTQRAAAESAAAEKWALERAAAERAAVERLAAEKAAAERAAA